MKLLVVGGGGREHAIVWKLAQSPLAEKIYCAPGNGGIAGLAECVDIRASDVDGLVRFARERAIDLVVVGPDDPLALGLVDALEGAGIRAFGPRKAAARLEWSKSYSKGLMQKYGIPTAAYQTFTDAAAALAYLAEREPPFVIKADGLALGKGVIIAGDRAEAEAAIRSIMVDRAFGDAGASVVIEEYLTGPEMTVLAFTDGRAIRLMPCSQDHKRAFDGDKGPNTGGMGAFAPSPVYTPEIARECEEKIFAPTLAALRREGIVYKGVLYFGLMRTPFGVKLIEYNARFGDPEAQAVLPLLKTDLLEIIEAVIDERLDKLEVKWDNQFSACVVAASGGYPGAYRTGCEITIAPPGAARDADAGQSGGAPGTGLIFHAGTRLMEDGKYYTAGGRVLGVTATGPTLKEAAARAYRDAGRVSFDGMFCRRDIALHVMD